MDSLYAWIRGANSAEELKQIQEAIHTTVGEENYASLRLDENYLENL